MTLCLDGFLLSTLQLGWRILSSQAMRTFQLLRHHLSRQLLLSMHAKNFLRLSRDWTIIHWLMSTMKVYMLLLFLKSLDLRHWTMLLDASLMTEGKQLTKLQHCKMNRVVYHCQQSRHEKDGDKS